MKFSINKLPKSQVEVDCHLSIGEFNVFFEEALLELGEDLEIKGFRKGKAPKNIVEQYLGVEKILIRAAEKAISSSYKKILQENNLEPISRPEVNIQKLAKNNPFSFKAKFFVLPEINLPDYKDIASKIKKRKIEVNKEEVEDSIQWLQKSRAKFSLKNGSAEKGDFIEIEYQSPNFKNFNNGNVITDAFILGEGKFLPGFEEQLVGMEAVNGKNEKEFSLEVPKGHSLEKYGKKIELRVKLKSVQKVELPEINDEFAKSLGNFEDLTALRKSIEEGIKTEKEQAESLRVKEEILEKISRTTECELPASLVEREQEQMLENFKNNILEKFKMSWEDYLKSAFLNKEEGEKKDFYPEEIKKKEEEIKKSFLPQAEKNIKKLLILREIGKREGIEVSEEEVEEVIQEELKNYSSPEEAKMKLGVDPEELKEYTKERIKNEKILSLLENFTSES